MRTKHVFSSEPRGDYSLPLESTCHLLCDVAVRSIPAGNKSMRLRARDVFLYFLVFIVIGEK